MLVALLCIIHEKFGTPPHCPLLSRCHAANAADACLRTLTAIHSMQLVQWQTSAALRCAQIIAQTAKFIREAGGQAEFVLSVRQAGNPNFAFLSRADRLHPYFRWLVRNNPQVIKPARAHDADRGASP